MLVEKPQKDFAVTVVSAECHKRKSDDGVAADNGVTGADNGSAAADNGSAAADNAVTDVNGSGTVA